MGVYIKNMEMPGRGEYRCIVRKWGEKITIDLYGDEELCGILVPVPDHGRLIDADALHQLFEEQWHYLQTLDWEENPKAEAKQDGVNWCINTMHDDAPTIIGEDDE